MRYNKLRGKIIELFGSQENFAKILGISKVSVSKKMNGKSSFSQKDIIKWANFLEIDSKDYGKYFFM